MPASTNDRTTAGPASGTASDRTKKMPVPTVAPTPNIVSWNTPMVRLRLVVGAVRDGRTHDRAAPQHLFGQAHRW